MLNLDEAISGDELSPEGLFSILALAVDYSKEDLLCLQDAPSKFYTSFISFLGHQCISIAHSSRTFNSYYPHGRVFCDITGDPERMIKWAQHVALYSKEDNRL